MWILGVDWVFEYRTIRRFAQPLLTVCVGSLGAGACGWEILTSCLQTLPVSRYFCCRKKSPPGGVNLTAGTFPVGHPRLVRCLSLETSCRMKSLGAL